MKRKITLIETVDFFGIDEIDGERIENRYIIGYFFDEKKIEEALCYYKEYKKESEEIVISEFDFKCSKYQKYVYVLFYEYSLIVDGEFQDFYEHFEPLSSYKKCLKTKNELLKNKKYQIDSKKIFDDSKDGFHIEKIKINFFLRFSHC